MSPKCICKQALLRGLRPSSSSMKIQPTCSSHCIFCDIWRLATVVSAHVPLSVRYGSKIQRAVAPQRSVSPPGSPKMNHTYDWEASSKVIESQFQTQRSRLASIMSICTVEGADESDGLYIAHERCLESLSEILYQEKILEETLLRSMQSRPNNQRRTSRDCGVSNSYYHAAERRPSMVGITI